MSRIQAYMIFGKIVSNESNKKYSFFCHYKNNAPWCYNLFLRNNF